MSRARDRLLVISAPGGGKSTAIWSIAIALPQSTVYLIDVEDKHLGIAEKVGGFPSNLKYAQASTWKEFHKAYLSFKDLAKPGDWIAVDNAGDPWHWRLDDFQIDKVLSLPSNQDKSLSDLKLTEGISDNDWGEVKRPWNETIPYTMLRQRGVNLFLAARVKPFIRIVDKRTGIETIKGHGSEMSELLALDASPDIYSSAIGDATEVIYMQKLGKQFFIRLLKQLGNTDKMNITKPIGFWKGYCESLGYDPKEVPGV